MKGIRIRETPSTQRNSDFMLFFGPVVPSFAHLWWAIQYSWPPFDFDETNKPEDEGGDPAYPYWVEQKSSWRLARSGILPAFGSVLRDDWCVMLGFETRPESLERFLQENKNVLGYGKWADLFHDVPELHSCFFNIDAAYWEFYSRDPVLLQTAGRHASGLPHVTAETIELEQKEF